MPSTGDGPTGTGPIPGTRSARVTQTPSGGLLRSAGSPASGSAAPARTALLRPSDGAPRPAATPIRQTQPRPQPRPNQLRDAVAPNTLRCRDETWAAWTPNARRPWSPGSGALASARVRGPRRLTVRRAALRRVAVWAAAAGVVPLLNREFRWEAAGLAMLLAAGGLAVLAVPSNRPHLSDGTTDAGDSRMPLGRRVQAVAVPVLGGALLVIGVVLAIAALLALGAPGAS